MRRILAALAGTTLVLAGCGGGPTAGGGEPTVVFAAASLAKPFEELVGDRSVSFSFDGSSGLVDQIAGGAPADVFASADERSMDRAVEAGLIVGEPAVFAENHLVIVTPPDNPAGVTGLDHSLGEAKVVVCAPEVPCGGAAARLAETNGVALEPVSEESSVTDVLGKVVSGEADAGLVYKTDALGAGGEVAIIEIPGAEEDPNTYWIGVVEGGDVDAAREFIALVQGEGQEALREHGFGVPNG